MKEFAASENQSRFDELDAKIMSVLMKDGRASNVDIARSVDASEATVRRRIEAMMDDGVFQVIAVANAYKIGLNVQVIINISIDPNQLLSVEKELSKIGSIRFLAYTTGQSDFIAQAFFPSNEELSAFLIEELSPIQGITKIQTNLILGFLKRTWDFQLNSPEIRKGLTQKSI